ncbi:hypothetical protein [Flavihumibacter sp. ZG627]|uniref:hypothetical protein n=1 Tax=Flavihumibacter sp. ZG627 TaxID=1463156 RepID=UPI00057DE854|nr:hypothetical protein [Flavihumibacter sp. ZG627]KIC91214.1 hypothetical protein HY58_09460 [Flavihumibacter sp. ZG627]
MKRISLWAKNHVYAARVLITIIQIALFFLVDRMANILGKAGIELPASLVFISLAVIGLCVLLYPRYKARLSYQSSYYKRKGLEITVAISSCIIIATCLNNNAILANSRQTTNAANVTGDQPKGSALVSNPSSQKTTILSKSSKKKELRTQWKALKKAIREGKDDEGVQIFLIILLGLGLALLLSVLVCSIACSGADAIAVLVAIAGTAGIIFLCTRLIQNATGKRPFKKRKQESAPSTAAVFEPSL